MTGGTLVNAHHCGIPKDYIPNLDEFVTKVNESMYDFIQHFTGDKYCSICEKAIKVSHLDDNEDLDVHLHNEHSEMEVINEYIKFLKVYQVATMLS